LRLGSSFCDKTGVGNEHAMLSLHVDFYAPAPLLLHHFV